MEQPRPAVKAGDIAPALIWTQILTGTVPEHLAGQVTVLAFFPVVSRNEHLVARWNQLVDRCAGQPIHFVWITSEYQPPLDPWLQKHPVNGCLLLDPLGATAQAYGIEFGCAIIDLDGRVAGFTFTLPEETQIQAVRDGRSVQLDFEPYRLPVPAGRPDVPPSFEVQISRSTTDGTDESEGPDWWVLRGFELKAMIARAYEKDPSRIILPDSLQDKERYDFVFVLTCPVLLYQS